MENNTYYPIRSKFAMAIYYLFDSIPFGFFVAGLIFDIIYFKTAEILWTKAAAWTIAIGLFLAIIPRLMNLYFVWSAKKEFRNKISIIGFWFYGFGILTAILNSFVHSRDAYSSASMGLLISWITVILIGIAYVSKAFENNHKL